MKNLYGSEGMFLLKNIRDSDWIRIIHERINLI